MLSYVNAWPSRQSLPRRYSNGLRSNLCQLSRRPARFFIGFALSWRLIFGSIAILALLLILALTRWLPSMPVVRSPSPQSFQRSKVGIPGSFFPELLSEARASMPTTSYVDPIMATVAHMSAASRTLIMFLAGAAMFIGNIVSAPLTKYYSDVALVCVGQTLDCHRRLRRSLLLRRCLDCTNFHGRLPLSAISSLPAQCKH